MRFTRDRRGQSVVVGTVILFGFLILAMSMYQVQIVPQQNAQVEFQHFEEVRNDMVNLRAGILQAGSSDATQYRTVQLGTTYSPRLFAINPPSPSGTIRTSESYPITITNGSDTRTIPTRFIEYRPGYHEIDQSPMWYDASVLYLDARDEGGGIAVIEDQNLVDSYSNEVQITALQNEFRQSGTGQVTLELRLAEDVNGTIPEGNLTVTVPTRLSGDEYWDDEANISSDVYDGVTSDTNGDGIHNLTLKTTNENLTVDTVGVQEAPNDVDTVSTAAQDGSENPSNPEGPYFESFTVEVEDTGSGSSPNIVSVSASGSIGNANPDGSVRLRLIDDQGTNSNSVTMNPLFDVTTETNGNVQQVDVELTLLDKNEQPIQSCTYTGLTTSASPLNKVDFNC